MKQEKKNEKKKEKQRTEHPKAVGNFYKPLQIYIWNIRRRRKKTEQKKLFKVIMTKNIPKLMIENITDPESSENTKKTKYQKCLHLGIYLSCVKPKKRNY